MWNNCMPNCCKDYSNNCCKKAEEKCYKKEIKCCEKTYGCADMQSNMMNKQNSYWM